MSDPNAVPTDPSGPEVENMVEKAVHALLREVSNLRTHVVEAGGVATPEAVDTLHSAALNVQAATGVGPVPGHDPNAVPQNAPVETPTQEAAEPEPPAPPA